MKKQPATALDKMPKQVKHKRTAPGEFECEFAELPGQRLKMVETARSVPSQLKLTIGAVTNQLPGDDDDGTLERARLEDTKLAIAALATGDLSNIQERLAAQAIATETAAHNLMQMAGTLVYSQGPNSLDRAMEFFRQASKFQDQSRKTLLALAEVRNPKRATFVKNQQNNLVMAPDNANQSKQLGEAHGTAMDAGTTGSAAPTMPEASTVGVQHRAVD